MSRTIYLNSHAMTYARYRQYRQFRNRIHPFSKFRNFWEFLVLHVFIINKFIFRFTSTFLFNELPLWLFYLGAFLEAIVITDLYVSVKTGYIDYESKRVVLDANESILKFCSTKLFLHLASAIPLHWFMFLRYGFNISCGLCKTNRFMCTLKFIDVISLFRIYEASAYYNQKHFRNVQFFKFFRIALLGITTMLQFYDFSETLCLLVFINSGEVIPYSNLALRLHDKYGIGKVGQNIKYIYYDLSRVLKSWLFFTFGFRERMYYLDKLFALLARVIANIFYAWTLLECYAVLSRLMYPEDQFMTTRDGTLNLLKSRQISEELGSKLEMYFNFKPVRSLIAEKRNEMYRCLPEQLKSEAKFSCCMKLIMRIPLFTAWPLPVLEEIVLMLKKEIFLPNAIVAEAWMQGDGLMILEHGVCAVYSPDETEIGHLIDGDYFGELSLVTDRELYLNVVVAVTPCFIYILNKREFRFFMRDHVNLFNGMKMTMKEKYNSSKALQINPELQTSQLTVSTRDDVTSRSAKSENTLK